MRVRAGWLSRKQIAHLSLPVAEWVEPLGLPEENAARIAGLPVERLRAHSADDPREAVGEADTAHHALVMGRP